MTTNTPQEEWKAEHDGAESMNGSSEDAPQAQRPRNNAGKNRERTKFAIIGLIGAISAMAVGGVLGYGIGTAKTNTIWAERMAAQQDSYDRAIELAAANSAIRPAPAPVPQQPRTAARPAPAEPSTVRMLSPTQTDHQAGSRPEGAKFEAMTLAGEPINLSDARGSVTLLAFWTPW